MKTRVGVIFGGRSGEHEISLRSAITVIEQMDRDKYDVVPIAIGKDGGWLGPANALGLLPAETGEPLQDSVSRLPGRSIALVGDTRFKGLTELEATDNGKRFAELDVVFPVLHGTYGED